MSRDLASLLDVGVCSLQERADLCLPERRSGGLAPDEDTDT